MKYTLAIAALLGLISVENTQAITLFSTTGQAIYMENSDSSDTESEDEEVQLRDDEEVDHSGEFFPAGLHEMLGGGGYERKTPANFAADSDDIFMRSMIEQYALEAKTKDGSPSGHFWMDEGTSRAAAAEVLATHKGMKGGALQKYLDTYFSKAWGHFDVNRTGKIEVIKMPQFMRFLASDQYMSLQP